MRIRWVGVPKEARKTVRKELRGTAGREFLVCSDKGRDQEIRKNVRESLWAFNADFIARHARGDLDALAVKALKETQEKLCEGANELISLIASPNSGPLPGWRGVLHPSLRVLAVTPIKDERGGQ